MATAAWASLQLVATAADYNAFFLNIQTALLAGGWTQTADPGQINFSSNATGAKLDPLFDYQMWVDNSKPTFPIYLKLKFMRVSSATPKMTAQIGSATDGAGNLIGNFSIENIIASATSGANNLQHYGSTGAGRAWFYMGAHPVGTPNSETSSGMFFFIERSKDATGATTDDFATIIAGGSAWFRQQSLHKTYGATSPTNRLCTCIPVTPNTNSFGGYGGVFPVFPALGRAENPLMDFATSRRPEQTDAANISILSYGTTRTYKTLNMHNTNGPNYLSYEPHPTGANYSLSFCLRYE